MASVSVPNRAEDFERLVITHSTALLRMCYLYLGDRMLAEDAVQETFIKAYEAFSNFRGECAEGTWLTRIAINTCKNHLRANWRYRVSRNFRLEDLPEPEYTDHYRDDALLREIARLPARYKEVILLYYYRELTAEEIAQALSITRDNALKRLSRARKRLKTRIKEWHYDE